MVDTACAHPTCDAGKCGVEHEPMGTATQWQVPGDCKKNVCDGNGNVVQANDDTDKPNDGNTCTVDTCTNGVPSRTNAVAGTMCGNKPSMTCDGAGHCTNCTNDSSCGQPGACHAWTCDDATQVCQQVFTPMGSGSPPGGTTHDCRRNVCDGMGGVITIAEPTDKPLDPSACVLGTCVGDMPSTTPAAATVGCFGGNKCDGMGNCGTCTKDADCGTVTECATPRCIGGHCSAELAASGTPTAQQTSGDCKKSVCNGSGSVTTVADDADVPPDPDACTIAGCSAGMPTMTPVMVPSSNNPCIVDGCNPMTGVFHDPRPDGTSCGGCSICQAATCGDPCPALGCVCISTTCGACL